MYNCSLAIIAHYATVIPHYKDGLKAVSRSMPTSAAVDRSIRFSFL